MLKQVALHSRQGCMGGRCKQGQHFATGTGQLLQKQVDWSLPIGDRKYLSAADLGVGGICQQLTCQHNKWQGAWFNYQHWCCHCSCCRSASAANSLGLLRLKHAYPRIRYRIFSFPVCLMCHLYLKNCKEGRNSCANACSAHLLA